MKILLAPHEINGQMRLLAEGLRARGHEAVSVNYHAGADHRRYQADVELGLPRSGLRLSGEARRARFALRAASEFDVFHFFFGRSLLPKTLDLPLLAAARKAVFVHFRGTDIKSKRSAMIARAFELGFGEDYGTFELQDPSQRIVLERWRRRSQKMFVSTPDLLHIAPDALWIPQVIDLERWPVDFEVLVRHRGRVVIGHAPTDRRWKGTQFVERAVAELALRGVDVELRVFDTLQPNEMREAMAACHLCVDQVFQGNYGNVSIEMMALGRPVVNFLDSIYTSVAPDLPSVHATPATLADVLAELIAEGPKHWRELGEQGRRYVEARHAVGVVCAQLEGIYEREMAGG